MARAEVVETNLDFGSLSVRPSTTRLVVHHVGGINRDVTAAEIHKWHLDQGWSGIGYHYVIRKDGTIERGRPRKMTGSHAYGYNSSSIGINVVGDFMNNWPTQEQCDSLVNLLADLCDIYELEASRDVIVGHRDLMETDCPGDNMYDILDDIVERVGMV